MRLTAPLVEDQEPLRRGPHDVDANSTGYTHCLAGMLQALAMPEAMSKLCRRLCPDLNTTSNTQGVVATVFEDPATKKLLLSPLVEHPAASLLLVLPLCYSPNQVPIVVVQWNNSLFGVVVMKEIKVGWQLD